MSSSKTGFKLGTLDPIIYYENDKGYCILAPSTEMARWAWETPNGSGISLKDKKFQIREADTLSAVDRLQKQLVRQETDKLESEAQKDLRSSEYRWKQVGSALAQRMASSSTSPFEREFIQNYLLVREDKREKHAQRWRERQMYLWAREFDSTTKATDRMFSEPGDMWERGV